MTDISARRPEWPSWMAVVVWRSPRLRAAFLRVGLILRVATKYSLSLAAATLLLSPGGPRFSGRGLEADPSIIAVADGEVAAAANGLCSLIEAIHNANDTVTGQPYADCAAGDTTHGVGEFDVILLPPQSVFTLTAADNTTYGRSGLPVITSPVRIQGETRAYLERDPAAEPFRVLAVGREGRLMLELVTISGGEAAQPARNAAVTYAAAGGGVLNLGQLIVNETVISGNTAAVGGGLYNGGELDGQIHLVGNQAGGAGDALLNFASVDLFDSDFRQNGGTAGATIVNEGEMSLTGGYVRDNGSTTGLRNRGTLAVYGTRFESGGVGVDNDGVATLTAVTITGHDTGIVNQSTTLIDRSAIVDNGRGILNSRGRLTLVNSTLSGNHATGDGGGLSVTGGEVYGSFNTFTGNAAERGGGVFVAGSYSPYYECVAGRVHLQYSILSGNAAGEGREAFAEPIAGTHCLNFLSLTGSLVGHDGESGMVNASNSAVLTPAGPLATIIEPEWTSSAGWIPHHRLPWGSPAIDALPNAACTIALIDGSDQLGEGRNHDGDYQPSEWECDVGAIERQPLPLHSFAPWVGNAEQQP